jgi:hypothetical protein
MPSRAANGGSLENNMWQAIFLGTTQKVSYTATPALSASVQPRVNLVRLFATTDCHIAIGVAPVATTNDTVLKADYPEYFCINPGEKISFRRRTTNGDVWITEGLGVDA